MFASLLTHVQKHCKALKNARVAHPLFTRYDKYQLDLINRSTNIKKHIRLKPKGWKYGITMRKNFVDKDVVFYVLKDQYHLPPTEAVISSKPVFLDLGSNIGLTVAHLKNCYPTATIFGYEMNTENFLLAQKNTKHFQDIQVLNTAVWIEDATVSYTIDANFDCYSILNNAESSGSGHLMSVPCLQMSSVFSKHNLSFVDYLKMDIEGAEVPILESSDLSWMQKVGAMNIEMHLEKENDLLRFMSIIEKQGFKVWKDTKHWSSILAVKRI